MATEISFRAYYYETRTMSGNAGDQSTTQRLLNECHDRAAQRSKLRHTDSAERHKLKKKLWKRKR